MFISSSGIFCHSKVICACIFDFGLSNKLQIIIASMFAVMCLGVLASRADGEITTSVNVPIRIVFNGGRIRLVDQFSYFEHTCDIERSKVTD